MCLEMEAHIPAIVQAGCRNQLYQIYSGCHHSEDWPGRSAHLQTMSSATKSDNIGQDDISVQIATKY